MTSRTNKLGMSLDEIIKLNKKRPGTGPGSVISRGTRQSQGRRGKGNRNYQSNASAVSSQRRFRGRGGRFNEVSYRNQFWSHDQGNIYDQSSVLKQYGNTRSLSSKIRNSTYAGNNRAYGSFRGRQHYPGQRFARNRVRLAARILNMKQLNRWPAFQYGNSGFVQDRNRVISTPRGFRGLPTRHWRGFRANQGIINSLRSDQITRLQKQQTVQRKLNQARELKSGRSMDKNSVTGSSDMLTVCISNDLATKRLGSKQHANTFKKFGGNNFVGRYGRGSFMRRNNYNNNRLGRRSITTTDGSSSMIDISPEGSIVTTISRYSRASPVGRNQQAGSVNRGVKQNRAPTVVEQYVPVKKERCALDLQLQKEIAAIQGKTFQSPTNFATFGSGSNVAAGLSGFKPVPSLTATTLNERFSSTL